MSPKPDVSEERTEQILDAAMAVFAERGFDKTRMEDVGARAGISKATVYLYFRSKEALIGALMKRVFNRELAALDIGETPGASARQRLLRFNDAMVEDLEHLRPLLPLLYEFYAMGLRRASVRGVLGGVFAHFIDVVTPVIREGINRGEFRDIDAHQTATALAATMEGTLLIWAFAPDQVDLETQLRHGAKLILEGISPASPVTP
ncbi:MAG: TetR/AcrR family transcriptional regulator [Anaerolineae bacterium]|nr:TetR/AcrR family transcriptional regulator [Anaerolineae bacterium]